MAVKTAKAKTKVRQVTPKNGSKTTAILAMAEARPELTVTEIGKLNDCSHVNVIKTLQRYGLDRERVDEFQNHKVRILAGIQEKFITELQGRSLEKESAHTLVVDAGIIQDKIRDIIHGKSGNSGINVNINIGDPTKTIDVTDT